MYESANASMWNGDRKQNQKPTLEQQIKKHVITHVWGFPDEQEEDSLSDRLKAELKDYVETVIHFTFGMKGALEAVAKDEMFEDLYFQTKEIVRKQLNLSNES
jgi:peptide subunit release factor 1 (eRF1)